jgi:hypothetical protein
MRLARFFASVVRYPSGDDIMKKRKKKNPFPWLSSFNERKFEPYIRAIGQSSLLWNDLHEWMGKLYAVTITRDGLLNPHFAVWATLTNDRAKREVLLAAAKCAFVDLPVSQSELQRKSYDSIEWLCIRTTSLEDDRNNVVHAPLFSSEGSTDVYPASAFGNQRATKLDDKYLLREYQRIRETAHLLRNYAAEIYDPMGDARLPWPDRPQLPDRGATKMPKSPPRPKLYTKPLPLPRA